MPRRCAAECNFVALRRDNLGAPIAGVCVSGVDNVGTNTEPFSKPMDFSVVVVG